MPYVLCKETFGIKECLLGLRKRDSMLFLIGLILCLIPFKNYYSHTFIHL